MTNEEAYRRLTERGTSPQCALRVLTYAYWAQLSGGWTKLFIPGATHPCGSEGEKAEARDILREAGVDPMGVSFPERLKDWA